MTNKLQNQMELSLSNQGFLTCWNRLLLHISPQEHLLLLYEEEEKKIYTKSSQDMQANIKQYYYWIRILW